ncbi:MAG: hypothetical protein ACU833_15505 [Gammaproteobacteria bacterium]
MPTYDSKLKAGHSPSSGSSRPRPARNPSGTPKTPASTLQQTTGNQAVQRMAAAGKPYDAKPTLQRKPSTESPDTASEEAAGDRLSPIRKELFELFAEYEKAVVGDEKFESIYKDKDWKDRKQKEKDYQDAKKKLRESRRTFSESTRDKHFNPLWELEPENREKIAAFAKEQAELKAATAVPVSKLTTCIAAQSNLLKQAFERSGLTIKKPEKSSARYDYATSGKQNAERLGSDIWHTAYPGMTERPKPGDIYVLAFRGAKIDNAEKVLNYLKGVTPAEIEKKSASNDKAQAALAAAIPAHDKAEAAVNELVRKQTPPTSADYIRAKVALSAAAKALKKAKEKSDAAAADLSTAQNRVSVQQKKLDEARKEADHAGYFQFSHVGFIQSITKLKDGRESWITFDGGQTVMSRGSKQGSETVHRFYDPVTNEISGEASQGRTPRWLQGWVDVDKLVSEK